LLANTSICSLVIPVC
ncbi:hypothetical protein CP8484711_0011C, partial [Chlamydia psittaci 84-8471/1]